MNYKLKLEGRNKIRKQIIKELENVPEGIKIKLDTKLLDELIFYKYTNTITNKQYKIPIWTGEFLRKLDLSDLSFEDAFLVGYSTETIDNIETKTLSPRNAWYNSYNMDGTDAINYIEEYEKCNDKKLKQSRYTFDFSYTNIKPDFSKLILGNCCSNKEIDGCNFEGVYLSKSKYEDTEIHNCNMKNTNIKNYNNNWSDNNFSNNDFSNTTVKLNPDIIKEINNFSNTGINIEYKFPLDTDNKQEYDKLKRNGLIENGYPVNIGDPKLEKRTYKYNSILLDATYIKEQEYEKIFNKALKHAHELNKHYKVVEAFKKGYFDGCYMNNKYINLKDIKAKEQSYEEYEQELMNLITSSIEEQKRNFGK